MLKNSNSSSEKNKFEGFSIDMINEIAKETPHLEFALELSKQIAYGSINDKGQWTGLIGELIERVGSDKFVEYYIIIKTCDNQWGQCVGRSVLTEVLIDPPNKLYN